MAHGHSRNYTTLTDATLNLLGISTEEWTRSIEHEAILQFVTRTSIRDAGNSSPVNLWVFDRQQAEYLRSYFDGFAYVTASIALAKDGPEIPMEKARGPKRANRSPAEQAEYEDERRRRDAARNRRNRAKKKALKKAA